jgi:hypothetical protein
MHLTMNGKAPSAFKAGHLGMTPPSSGLAVSFLSAIPFARTGSCLIPRKARDRVPLVSLTTERQEKAFSLQQVKNSVRSVRHPF